MLAVIMALVGDGRRDAGEDDGGNPEVDSMFGEISLPFAFIPLELHRVNVTTNSSYEKFEIDMLDELRKIRYARFRLEMTVVERLQLPSYKSSTFRGAFGHTL